MACVSAGEVRKPCTELRQEGRLLQLVVYTSSVLSFSCGMHL